MKIENKIIKHYLKNVYFITGTAYAGKSTTVKMLSERYNMVFCGENYHSEVSDIVATADKQPDISYINNIKNWKEFVTRTPQEYERWIYSVGKEAAEFEVAKLISGNGAVFAILAGIILAGILAATMSTSDSQLLAAASAVSQNIVKEFFGKTLSQKTSMLVARLTVVVIAIVGVIWAKDEGSVFEIVSFAWAGFGAAFGPVVLFALFWKRTNKWGALAGMVSGGVMIFVWKYVIAKLGGVFAIYELLPAFVIACVAIVVVSLITKAPEKEIIKDFEAVKSGKVD